MNRIRFFNEEKVITAGLIVLFFLLPLVFQPFLSDPFALPKATVLRIMVLFILAVWLTKVLREGKIRWQRTPLNLPIIMFLLICGLSTLFSVSPRLSLWGMHGFYFEGFLSFLCYGIVYFIAANYVTDKRKILKTLLIASVIVSVYALVQASGITFFVWRGTQPYPRVWSTLGNPNFLGPYLIMVIPIYLVFLMRAETVRKKLLYSLFTLISVLALIFTYSRAAWLGMAVGLIVFAFMVNKKQLKANSFFLMGIMVSSIILVSIYPRLYLRPEERTATMKPIVERAVSTVDFKEPGITARLSAWETTIKMTLKRPILGFGLDTLGMSFRRFMSKDYEKLAGRFSTAGYAHNEFLQYGTTIGLVGLGAYLFLLFVFFRILIKVSRGKDKNLLVSGLCASCVALLVNNQFSFSTIVPATLLWFFFGLGVSLSEGEKKEFQFSIPVKAKYSISAAVVVVTGLLCLFCFRFLVASRFDRLAQDSQADRNWEQAIVLQEKSVEFNPLEGIYRMHLAKIYQEMIGNAKTIEQKEEFFRKSRDEYQKEITAYPYHALAYNGLGVTYIYANSFLNKKTSSKASKSFEKAIEFDPYFIEAYSNLAAVIYQRGEVKKAIGLYEKTIELRPGVALSYYNLGNLYAQEGDYSQAIKNWQKTLRVDPNFKEAEQRLLQVWQDMEK
ncbi:MAG: O-antigen ligase family protein [Elusimicrobiota bacterium]|nr:O-antigen ligase family protein [Elusimicrobiota bacterium]